MDRPETFAIEYRAAVRIAGTAALDLLLHTACRECGELASDATNRRVIPAEAVFRQPENRLRVGGESQTCAAADAPIRTCCVE